MTPRRYRSYMMDSRRWDAFELRAGDVVVTTPPKCGTTWMQMCCLLLVHGAPLPAPLSTLSPWLDQVLIPIDELAARLAAQHHRRVIKTHTPLDGLPWRDDVTYVGVGRDPRDVALSLGDHRTNMNPEALQRLRAAAGSEVGAPPPPFRPSSAEEMFLHVVDDDSPVENATSSLRSLVNHVRTMWVRQDEPNVALFHYRDLQRDLDGEMRRLAAALGVPVDEDPWAELVAAATFEAMKEHADVLAPNADRAMWNDNSRFFAEGRLGGWRGTVPEASLARYDERIRELSDDDAFVAWLHDGWLAA